MSQLFTDADQIFSIVCSGDVAKASKYIGFAKNKARYLAGQAKQLNTGPFSRVIFMPNGEAEIYISVVGNMKNIHIVGGGLCNERTPGFVVTEQHDYSDTNEIEDEDLLDKMYLYTADGTVEEFTPIGGKPRPTPVDPATKLTKKLRVPPEIRLHGNDGVGPPPPPGGSDISIGKPAVDYFPASLYSGLMREAVQCIHATGANSPYRPDYQRTHGIVEYPRPRVVGSTKAEEKANERQRRRWLVEISTSGIYATLLPHTGRCCDQWVPKIADKEANKIDYQKISLASKFAAQAVGDTTVLKLANVHPNFVSTLKPQHRFWGWAFSYSGHEAQIVVYNPAVATTTSVSRFKVAFTVGVDVDNNPTISAVMTREDFQVARAFVQLVPRRLFASSDTDDALQTETFDRDLWNTSAFWPIALSSATLGTSPMFVFYDGDSARVVNYTQQNQTIGPFTPGTPFSKSIIAGGPACSGGWSYGAVSEVLSSSPTPGSQSSTGGTNGIDVTGAFTENIANAYSRGGTTKSYTRTFTTVNTGGFYASYGWVGGPACDLSPTPPPFTSGFNSITGTAITVEENYGVQTTEMSSSALYTVYAAFYEREAIAVNASYSTRNVAPDTGYSSLSNTTWSTSTDWFYQQNNGGPTTQIGVVGGSGTGTMPGIYTSGSTTVVGSIPGSDRFDTASLKQDFHIFMRSEHIVLTGITEQYSPSGWTAGLPMPFPVDQPQWGSGWRWAMGGAQYYDSPLLTPAAQKTNKVMVYGDRRDLPTSPNNLRAMLLSSLCQVTGGFNKPDGFMAGFIGKV